MRHSQESTPGRAVWIDMEHSPYVDVTLDLYRRARKAHFNAGVCVQALSLPHGEGSRLAHIAWVPRSAW